MKSYTVSIHLPAVGKSAQGMPALIGIITPEGILYDRHINQAAADGIEDPVTYAEDLILRMFPARAKSKMHGGALIHREYTDTSATVCLVRVDVED